MDAAQKGRRSKGQWTEERSENLANLWNAIELEMGEQGRTTKTAVAAAIVAKGGLFSDAIHFYIAYVINGSYHKSYRSS